MGFSPIPTEPGAGAPPPILAPIPPPIIAGAGGADPASVSTALGRIVAYDGALASWLQGYTGALVSQLTSTLKGIFAQVLAWLQRISHTWLGRVLASVWQRVMRIYTAVSTELQTIIKTIRWYERLVQQWQDKIFKPALELMQRLRRVLFIFRLFHFKFATQLDRYLAARESEIARVMLDTRREINRVLNYLNLVFDPFGYFNRGIFLASAIRSIADLWNAVAGAPSAKLTPAQAAAADRTAHQFDSNQVYKTVALVAATGATPSQEADREAVRLALLNMGYNL